MGIRLLGMFVYFAILNAQYAIKRLICVLNVNPLDFMSLIFGSKITPAKQFVRLVYTVTAPITSVTPVTLSASVANLLLTIVINVICLLVSPGINIHAIIPVH